MFTTPRPFALLLTLAATACDNAPAANKTSATVQEPTAAPSALAAPAPAGAKQYVFSQAGSKISFVGAKLTGKHNGSFETFQGKITAADADLKSATVATDIDVASVVTDSDKLTQHLKTPDLLDATKYPKARFISTSVATADKPDAYLVSGNFELHGVTKGITFPAEIHRADGIVDVTAEFAINRKDFGVTYPGMPDDLIKDEVLLNLQLHATLAQK